jgi:hypothetical protein
MEGRNQSFRLSRENPKSLGDVGVDVLAMAISLTRPYQPAPAFYAGKIYRWLSTAKHLRCYPRRYPRVFTACGYFEKTLAHLERLEHPASQIR